MGKKLAIKGHPTRGKEVIALLEMLGGKNHSNIGNDDDYFYYINDKNNIEFGWTMWDNNPLYTFFTLEEFLNKYPFKVNDKVFDKADGCSGVVCEMKWDEDVSDMKYCVAFGNGIDFGWFANDSIEFCKENKNLEETQSNQDIDKDVFRKEFCECCGSQRCSGQDDELEYCERFKNLMDNSGKQSDKNHKMGSKSKFPPFEPMFKMNDELEYKIPDGYEITEVSKDKVFIKPIKSKYPTTYEECCEVLNWNPRNYDRTGYKFDILCKLQVLLICRDAYWKIAGEQMGLDKPWDSTYGCGEWGYWFGYSINENKVYLQDSRILVNHTLVFPTEEMRDAFYENFKDLIEQCKELL